MLGTVARQFEIASYLLTEDGKDFSQLQYITPENLLKTRSEDRVKELLEEIDYTLDGQKKLIVIANLDLFLGAYPECKEQMLLVFQNLMLSHGMALLNLKEGDKLSEKPVIVLGMTEALYKEHFSEYSDVGFLA